MNDLTNVLGLLAQSPAHPIYVTVVLILFSPAQPVAMDLHANTLPLVLPAQPGLGRGPRKLVQPFTG